MIPIHKLEHVVALAERRSYRRAAESLHLTQPALSRSIQSLERALGVRLFDRGRGGVEPTAVGALLVTRARDILSAVGDLEHEIDLVRGLGAGNLEVSLAPYPSALSGQRAVARLLTEHPEIQCRVRVAGFSPIADDVAEGRSEIGVADLGVAMARGLAAEPLVRRPLFFVARKGHPLARAGGRSLEQLLGFPWAGIRAPSRMVEHFPADLGRAGRWDRATGEFVPALELDAVSEFLVLARDSDILVVAGLAMAERELAAGRLAVVPFTPPWLHLDYGFISRPNRTLSPATLRFMEIVRGIEAELDEREQALQATYL
ncbi:MAG: LysR family transcriptional regulator [Thermoanaerobaculales bacterium]|jgi:DNA-binding transcriptional LysR family regulator|nr:LysR family transcriptional regulator [Thermoanaerobaculales bacterium]